MAMILSVLAICIALIAIWMVSHSSKSSEGGFNAFLQSARNELNTAKTDIDKNLSDTIKRLNDLGVIIEDINENSSKSNTALSDLQNELAALRHDLEALEASIPKQYRNVARKSSGNLHH
jgi:peptidoglycan hydrolase CwlO-like protein